MNKKTKFAVIAVIALVLVTIGITYAYWLITRTQTDENVISTACLDISLTNEQNDILLTNQFPLSNEEGATLTPYTFTVTNNCDTSVDYQIALETFDTTTTMQATSIKAMMDEDEPLLLGNASKTDTTIENATNAYILKYGTLAAKDAESSSASHALRIWIDEDAPISEMNRTFESKISVTIGQGITNSKLCMAATAETVTTGNIPVGNYENGDEYICEVADDTFYHFFVISKNETIDEATNTTTLDSVNLIMDRNVGTDGTPATSENLSQTAWCSKEDYDAKNAEEEANGTSDGVDAYLAENPTYCGSATVMTEEGPITALRALNNYVSSWSNINNNNYSLVVHPYRINEPNDGELSIPDPAAQSNELQSAIWTPYTLNAAYIKHLTQDETKTTLKARLMTVDEALEHGCKYEINTTNDDGTVTKTNVDICPRYLTNNLQHKEGFVTGDGVVDITGIRGYWLLTGGGCSSYLIHDNGSINVKQATVNNHSGIRPVITVNLTDFNI